MAANKNSLPYWVKSDATLPPVVLALPNSSNSLVWPLTKTQMKYKNICRSRDISIERRNSPQYPSLLLSFRRGHSWTDRDRRHFRNRSRIQPVKQSLRWSRVGGGGLVEVGRHLQSLWRTKSRNTGIGLGSNKGLRLFQSLKFCCF